jgi:hypothetical protein
MAKTLYLLLVELILQWHVLSPAEMYIVGDGLLFTLTTLLLILLLCLYQWYLKIFVHYILVTILWFFRGDFGRLGHGDHSDLFIPHPIRALQGLQIKQIACGDCHCLAVTMESKVLRYVALFCFRRGIFYYIKMNFSMLRFYISLCIVSLNYCILLLSWLKLGAESKWWTWTWYHKGFSCATKCSSIWGTLFWSINPGYL